ncbi:hypothetical protein [Porphyromonas gingivalis]|jgi:hypothetical protein|uniref:hypothetical protein n=1 Tax=Porphyromonas gingivalis TaxID=837 RepID=UPI000C19E31E|nr:hypothetical protein [Porphyromonas gingivalis]ATS03257.1 hypothetical protein CS059_09970 [Porphyromonas gingivalis]MDP0531482.1 hypothetical protein [Porphyromonas gingivalis]MDP0624206.1 hypothetical protein [Porphyromonas gingivalis]WKD52192.1 hypothetical protein NF669_07995 [Porphyromonas gingivalis]WKD54243.1 hypothetical protein NF668_08005 [Porphyromonas gingivalis]
MKKKMMEEMLSSEMKEVQGGVNAQSGTCVCENGGAAETVIIELPEEPEPAHPILTMTQK